MRMIAVSVVALAMLQAPQEGRATYTLDYPYRIRVGSNLGDLMGKAELVLWTRGDSAFGTFTPTEPEKKQPVQLFGIVRGDNIHLREAATTGTVSGAQNGTMRSNKSWDFVRQSGNLVGNFHVSFGGALPDVTRQIIGRRAQGVTP